MTLRDWFAGQALVGYIAKHGTLNDRSSTIADYCYTRAAAMLAERAKTEASDA
jgi:hypothetical protein